MCMMYAHSSGHGLSRRQLFVALSPILWVLKVFSFRSEHFLVRHSHHLDWWRVSVLTTAHCKHKHFWPRLRAALGNGYYKINIWENSLTCPFSKTAVVGSPPRSYYFPSHRLLNKFTVPGMCPLPWSKYSNPIRKELVVLQKIVMPLLHQHRQKF